MSEALDRIQPGDRVGPYRIVRGFKGRGGMGGVFEVEVRKKYRQPGIPRRLALKVAREEYQAALTAEADFLRRFDHPNVVCILPLPLPGRRRYAAREMFSFGWGWYYTMELVRGGSLERRLTDPTTVTDLLRSPQRRERRLSLLVALGVARQVTAALEHIHERHVVNLDVKPGNVLFRRRRLRFLRGSVPQAVLCDFGIARDMRYPRVGLLGVATPEYVSPEQASEMGLHHQQVDARSDVFSLGIMLYEILTGALPFDSVVMAADPTYKPLPPRQLCPSIPSWLEKIIMRALAKDPDHRFQTATEMRVALEQVPTPLDWRAATRRVFAGVTLTAGLVAGSWGVKTWTAVREPTPTPTAEPSPIVETATYTPSAVPPTITPTVTPTAKDRHTSTPRPTSTATNTPRPLPTTTPVPEGG
jgi:eukaryotic-like serine/threonine-protein kinase